MTMLLHTGQRRADVVSMRWDDIENGHITAHQIKSITGHKTLIEVSRYIEKANLKG